MWHRCKNNCAFLPSRLARALWIEIKLSYVFFAQGTSRGSREPCGLKFCGSLSTCSSSQSRLARALWIEMGDIDRSRFKKKCRGSREPCGLKFAGCYRKDRFSCRGSREPCGLKLLCPCRCLKRSLVEARESLVD